jgi:hypothetical protein
MGTRAELQRERDALRAKIREARAILAEALLDVGKPEPSDGVEFDDDLDEDDDEADEEDEDDD